MSMTPDVAPFINGLSSQSLLLLSLALVAGLLIGAFQLTLFWKIFLRSEVITFSKRKSRSRGTALLLVGPSDSGKTALLSTVCGLPRKSHRLFISESFLSSSHLLERYHRTRHCKSILLSCLSHKWASCQLSTSLGILELEINSRST